MMKPRLSNRKVYIILRDRKNQKGEVVGMNGHLFERYPEALIMVSDIIDQAVLGQEPSRAILFEAHQVVAYSERLPSRPLVKGVMRARERAGKPSLGGRKKMVRARPIGKWGGK